MEAGGRSDECGPGVDEGCEAGGCEVGGCETGIILFPCCTYLVGFQSSPLSIFQLQITQSLNFRVGTVPCR